MDKTWMQEPNRFSEKYVLGVRSFIRFAKDHKGPRSNIRCPCCECLNVDIRTTDEVEDHLFLNGISLTYTRWIHHGEQSIHGLYGSVSDHNNDEEDADEAMTENEEEDEDEDEMQEMLEDIYGRTFMDNNPVESFDNDTPNIVDGEIGGFDKLLREAGCELYPNCKKFSTLSFLIKLLHLKVMNRWSNKSFNMLLELLKEAFLDGETLPKSLYEARKMLGDLGLGYVLIHACKHDCVLFWKELENQQECPICGESRWKVNGGKGKQVPHKVLRYFPLKPRLQRLFMSRKTANDMRWHNEKRATNVNVLRHPADSEAWKDFDKEHEWFSLEP